MKIITDSQYILLKWTQRDIDYLNGSDVKSLKLHQVSKILKRIQNSLDNVMKEINDNESPQQALDFKN